MGIIIVDGPSEWYTNSSNPLNDGDTGGINKHYLHNKVNEALWEFAQSTVSKPFEQNLLEYTGIKPGTQAAQDRTGIGT